MPKNKRNKRKKGKGKSKNIFCYSEIGVVSITPGANKGFTENVENLMTVTDSLSSPDGIQTQLSKLQYHFDLYCDDCFWLKPLVVQSNGTWTDTVNLADTNVHVALGDSINDVFSWEPAGPVRQARYFYNGGIKFNLRFTVNISKKFLDIINTHTEQERIVDIFFGLIGEGYDGTKVLSGYVTKVREYTLRPTKIINRL